jgi:sporulation protein YlmC with PRC-barrel domain
MMNNPLHQRDGELQHLNTSELTLADRNLDIRDRKVVDRDGLEIGRVSDLFIDPQMRKVRMIEISAGGFLGFGARHALLPVDAITSITAGIVNINQTREHLAHSPVYDPKLIVPRTFDAWEPYYNYYGLSPYWGESYMYPDFPVDRTPPVRD